MNNSVLRFPMLRMMLPFTAGTLFAIVLSIGYYQIVSIVILLIIIILLSVLRFNTNHNLFQVSKFSASKQYSFRWMSGLFIFLISFTLSIVNVWLHTPQNKPDFFLNKIKPDDKIVIQIIAPLQFKGNTCYTIAKIKALGNKTEINPASGDILIYFQKDSTTQYPEYGDQIIINNVVKPIPAPLLDGEFNFKDYMSLKGISDVAYLKKNDWINTGNNDGNPLWIYIYAINSRIKSELSGSLPDSSEKGIAEALIIGNENDIPVEIMNNYTGTGTVHILSVSGLHVGIIMMGLSWIFSFLTKIPQGKYIRLILILIITWAYAFLTGFSPPIARSVIMFSIVFIGLNLGRRTNIYNTISASAFILLLSDPFLILQASFQLSFIALTGIVWLQPQIASLWHSKNKAVKYFRELAAASIAAQIITFPLSIMYFHQLSVYFLPANLVVIPASFVVLLSGIAFVFASLLNFSWLIHFFSAVLSGTIFCLNQIVGCINKIPGATWHGLYLPATGVVVLYLFVILITAGIQYKNKRIVRYGMILGILFFFQNIYYTLQQYNRNEINILSIAPKHTVITLKNRNHLLVLSDTGFTNNSLLMKNYIDGYAWKNKISPANIICINYEINHKFSQDNIKLYPPYIQFGDEKILVINSNTHIKSEYERTSATDIDVVVLSNNANLNLSELYRNFRFKSIIAAAGNNIKHTRMWETESIENKIPFINLQNNNCKTIHI